MNQVLAAATAALLLALPQAALAQRSPFLPDPVYDALVNELSGDIAFEHVRWFTHYHRPMGGGEGFEAVARYVEEKAREYGLEDVRYIRLEARTPSWTPRLGELWLVEPTARRLAFSPEVALSLADYSRPADVPSAELVDVGAGTTAADYEGLNVAGTVVLATGPLATVMQEAVWTRGALGIIYFTEARRDFPDQVPWVRIPVASEDASKPGTFAFVLSQREGRRLRRELAATETPYRVRLRIESEFPATSSQAIVEAVIRGTEIHDQDLVLTGHLQEERFSANDDASGCASVLEIARALKRMIDDGRLPRPRRDIRFWWADEIGAEEQYFADHPGERRQFLANINQDMVGARQSYGSRVQFVTRPPASRASFLGDVVESVVESLVTGNTAYLAAGMARQLRAGGAGPTGGSVATAADQFSRPVLARLGSREQYDARVIPFHNSTDHQVFNMPLIGIPGVTFTNWPDDYIHSSADDLWQMDATQLKRNALAVAGAAWFLANARANDLPSIAGEMVGRGHARIGRGTARALQMLAVRVNAPWRRRAFGVVRESVERERRAIRTLARLAPEGGAGDVVTRALEALPTADAVEAQVRALAVPVAVPELPSALEIEQSTRVPRLVDDFKALLARRSKLERPPGLHPLMAYEVLNFVDGRRSCAEIFTAVAAEADTSGAWYYGEVSLEDVVAYLDSAERAGIVTVATRAHAPVSGEEGRR